MALLILKDLVILEKDMENRLGINKTLGKVEMRVKKIHQRAITQAKTLSSSEVLH